MQVWTHDKKNYEVNSYYSLPDDGWQYELVGPVDAQGGRSAITVIIPDATPHDAPFTPLGADQVQVHAVEGHTPWRVVKQLVDLVEGSGDLIPGGEPVIGTLDSASDIWQYACEQFEVNSFPLHENDSWCYELYRVGGSVATNDYLEVRIPSPRPEGGPLAPGPADGVTLIAHGSCTLPWLVVRHFLDRIEATGDIAETTPPAVVEPTSD